MNVSQIIPKEQKAIILKALTMLDEALKGFDQECNDVEYQRHDIISLKAFMEYDVSVTMSKERKEKFCFIHSVDFPEYTGVDAKYPIEVKPVDEWVTVMTGDFSFFDDDIHQREAHVNNLVGIQRHLRSQVEDVISDLDDGGHGWLVVEDYDGAIITDTKKEDDKRSFQVTYLKSHYDPQTMIEDADFFFDNGFSDEDINEIQGLDISDQYTTQQGGVIIVRLSDTE